MGVFLKKGRGNLLIIFLPSISLPYTLLSTSILVCSSDKHYSTSQHQCGLDLSVTRQFFEKLSRKEKVLKEVALKFILFAQFTTIWDLWQVMANLVLLSYWFLLYTVLQIRMHCYRMIQSYILYYCVCENSEFQPSYHTCSLLSSVKTVATPLCLSVFVSGWEGGAAASAPLPEPLPCWSGGPQGLPHPAWAAEGAAQTAAGDRPRCLIGWGHSQAASWFVEGSWWAATDIIYLNP